MRIKFLIYTKLVIISYKLISTPSDHLAKVFLDRLAHSPFLRFFLLLGAVIKRKRKEVGSVGASENRSFNGRK